MRQKAFWIAASCVLAVIGLRPVFSSGAAPASKEKVIYSFTGGADGGQPMSDLTIGADGNLYGTTSQGGVGCVGNGCGTVFELKRTQDGWKEQILYSFAGGNDGAIPEAGVVFDKAGNLYGTTVAGGNNQGGTGTVFKLSPNSHGGWTESVIGYADSPTGDLVFDDNGNLYGANSQGGSGGTSCNGFGCGTVFELTPQAGGSWKETTIHLFEQNSSDGVIPSSGVVLDFAGNVYGETLYGGAGACDRGGINNNAHGCGAIYELTPNPGGSWTEIVYSLVRGGGFGIFPSGGLLLDQAGRLLSTTQQGGDGFGTVFELRESQKKGWQQSVLHRFYGHPDGVQPAGRLAEDAHGNLFGVSAYGGSVPTRFGYGTVFELARSGDGWKEKVLYRFSGGTDATNPQTGLVLDTQGRLYGTSQSGGNGTGCDGGCGTVYEVVP
jgi:uncharacterized repeat protein (TIGR03803 family)